MDNSAPLRGARLLVFHPRQLEDAQALIRAVKANQTVVLNASGADAGEAHRLIDFACGGREAIDGQTHRIDAETFLFTPARWRPEASALVRPELAISSRNRARGNRCSRRGRGCRRWPGRGR
jgi:FtsZ-interacting cell division protein YlmF